MTEALTLLHYSAKPFTLDARRYEQHPFHCKPNGLWLSVGDDWKRWCEGEAFDSAYLTHCTRITLAADANVLTIVDAMMLDAFTEDYGRSRGGHLRNIDWPRVAAEYDGIVIAPYVWERRLALSTFWYYSWDCASACVWNVDTLSVVRES